jgi:sterol desaturase/sphingolipid hydroxylase (fatty acid hydroxylase superfamily)
MVQFVLALIILDFFQYWWHRWSHEVPFLWRFHATHHSPKRLYWVNTGRFHPIDALVSHVIGFGPLILMGISAEALLLVTAWVSADGMFQHCNIRLRFGPLNWIFSTAELHRWHHSVRLSESNTNYGENIILWDIVFGTRFLPGDRDASETVGLTGLDKFPQNYLGQIASPFKWRDIERASTA